MNLKLPPDIEQMLVTISETRRKAWLAKFEAMTPAAQQAAIEACRAFDEKYAEPPCDINDPPTEADRQEVEIRTFPADRARQN